MKSYKEIESFLFRQLPMYQRIGPKAFKKDLKNIKHLSKITSHPHKAFKSIHIAGTNGKGSTSFFIATALFEHGYKVGLYTSPHYKSYRERIRVDGKMIKVPYIKKFVNKLIAMGLFKSEFKPSFFEISVAMAFSYFKEEEVDYAVIETGLGGRLDSTNVINPVLSIITNISKDHTNFLGNTLNKIAREKAGIIKKNVPLIVGRTQKETKDIFKSIAKEKNAKLIFADKKKYETIGIYKGHADFQLENLQTALTALHSILKSPDYKKIQKAWSKTMKSWSYLGRYQFLSRKPKILVDSAHNEAGIKNLFDQIKNGSYKNLHIVLAVVNDKDLSHLLSLFPEEAIYYFSQAKIPRALDAKVLLEQAGTHGLMGKTYSSVKRALSSAKRKAGSKDLILVTGSIFTVAEVV